MPQKIDNKFFAEVNRLRKKFPKLTQAQAYKLADQNLNPKRVTIKLDKKPVVNRTGKLMPKGKLKPQGVMQTDKLITKLPARTGSETVIIKEEKKGISIYLIIAAAAAAYYFLFKKKR